MVRALDAVESLIIMGPFLELRSNSRELSQKLRESVKLNHLLSMVDNNALLQHARFSIPARKEGYAVDDNARALVFAVKAHTMWPDERLFELQRKLMSFLLLMQSEDGKFHNYMDFSQRIIDESTVGDHLGRAVWAAGTVINSDLPKGLKQPARQIFDRALPWARESTSPRTKAYACLGLHERLTAEETDSNLQANLKTMAEALIRLYNARRSPNWEWFEDVLTYDNARLAQALFATFESMKDQRFLTVAEKTLQFLRSASHTKGTFAPVGSEGWYSKGGKRALYDQQPIEAGAMIEAAALAYRSTRNEWYQQWARQALGWFFGLNNRSVVLYDDSTGACYDGITPEGLNENQGAESTLAFLLAAEAFIRIFQDE